MYESIQKFHHLLTKSNPGFSFNQAQRQLTFTKAPTYQNDKNMKYHFASKTQKIYSPFQTNYYVPPHLNSTKAYGLIHKGECKAWKIRHNNTTTINGKQNIKQKQINSHHVHNMDTNYDIKYRKHEDYIKALPGKKYYCIEPRIKYLIDQDRPSRPNKLKTSSDEQEQNQNESNNQK